MKNWFKEFAVLVVFLAVWYIIDDRFSTLPVFIGLYLIALFVLKRWT